MSKALVVAVALVAFAVAASAETNFAPPAGHEPCVITIKGVYLKDDAGRWVNIVEPDRRVDLSREEPVVSFFNNKGRVPAGLYRNFRIDFTGREPELRRLSSKDDFDPAVAVKKGSFIRVAFGLGGENGLAVSRAELAVDSDERGLDSAALQQTMGE